MNPVKDWRGTPINPGDLVIYGSSVGRSVQLNEARVASVGEDVDREGHCKIRLQLIRRSFSSSYAEFVTVGSDRMTIVGTLPVSDKPELAGKFLEENEKKEKAKANIKSHKLSRPKWVVDESTYSGGTNGFHYNSYNYNSYNYDYNDKTGTHGYYLKNCSVCGLSDDNTWVAYSKFAKISCSESLAQQQLSEKK